MQLHMEGYLELSRLCKVNGLELQRGSLDLLRQYVDLLLSWNSKINLISRRDEENIWIRHILHSMSLLFHVELQESARVLDLGTGGGLPGIPLAIMRPDLHVTLLDSIRKKTGALENIVSALHLKNAEVICGRAGELRLDRMKDVGYDVVIARAVANVRELIRWSSMLTRKTVHSARAVPSPRTSQGRLMPKMPFLVAMKGGAVEEEISSARTKFPGMTTSLVNLSVKGLHDQELIEKKIVVVEL